MKNREHFYDSWHEFHVVYNSLHEWTPSYKYRVRAVEAKAAAAGKRVRSGKYTQ